MAVPFPHGVAFRALSSALPPKPSPFILPAPLPLWAGLSPEWASLDPKELHLCAQVEVSKLSDCLITSSHQQLSCIILVTNSLTLLHNNSTPENRAERAVID